VTACLFSRHLAVTFWGFLSECPYISKLFRY